MGGKIMSAKNRMLARISAVLPTLYVAGCGAHVPEIEEFWGTAGDASRKVNLITFQVKCEVAKAVKSVIDTAAAPVKNNPNNPKIYEMLNGWGAQVTLTLTIDEKSALNPGVTFNTVLENGITKFSGGTVTSPQSFSWGLGGTFSSDAMRTDKLTNYYLFRDLYNYAKTPRSCIPPDNTTGYLFVQSDLKIDQWLKAALLPEFTGIANYEAVPAGGGGGGGDSGGSSKGTAGNVISHDVKFEIVSTGNVTPTWKLVRVSANTGSSPLFGATRDRTQELLITLGPSQRNPDKTIVPSASAQSSHLAAEIGSAVAASIKSSQ
jgi:hypothetical protein